jgi:hypothetical protein
MVCATFLALRAGFTPRDLSTGMDAPRVVPTGYGKL